MQHIESLCNAVLLGCFKLRLAKCVISDVLVGEVCIGRHRPIKSMGQRSTILLLPLLPRHHLPSLVKNVLLSATSHSKDLICRIGPFIAERHVASPFITASSSKRSELR